MIVERVLCRQKVRSLVHFANFQKSDLLEETDIAIIAAQIKLLKEGITHLIIKKDT